jgi:hypothetical protein
MYGGWFMSRSSAVRASLRWPLEEGCDEESDFNFLSHGGDIVELALRGLRLWVGKLAYGVVRDEAAVVLCRSRSRF